MLFSGESPRIMSAREAGIRFVPPPIGACREWIFDLLVGAHLREVALFLGQKNSLGDFIPHGTAFVIHKHGYGRALTYMVTAKHVLEDIPGDEVLLRANGKAKSGIKYLSLLKEKWHYHPKHRQNGPNQNYIDVAVYEVDFDWREFEIVLLADTDVVTEEIIKEYDIGTGDEVVIPSLFYSHIGSAQNVPVIRTGNIAAMRLEPVPTSRGMMDGYLVETRSIGGVSGSPVAMNMAVRPDTILPPHTGAGTWEPKSVNKSKKPHLLLGLVHGYYTIVDQHEWVSKTDQQIGDINTGISIVVPAEKILETISPVYEKSVEMAKKLDEEMKRRSGAKTASAAHVADLPANGENPNHREDFTTLLGAASKTSPQGDQT